MAHAPWWQIALMLAAVYVLGLLRMLMDVSDWQGAVFGSGLFVAGIAGLIAYYRYNDRAEGDG